MLAVCVGRSVQSVGGEGLVAGAIIAPHVGGEKSLYLGGQVRACAACVHVRVCTRTLVSLRRASYPYF